jgi:cobalt-zinc-cadmium efflux system outer membrane protein
MKQFFHSLSVPAMAALFVLAPAFVPAQQTLTWDQAKAKFEANNPALRADALNVEETKAQEITAYLRPNPQVSFSMDQLYPYPDPTFRPFTDALTTGSVSYLHEREHKRELRLQAAQEGTQIAQSQHTDPNPASQGRSGVGPIRSRIL